MYLRFVQVRVKPDRIQDVQKNYDERVIPVLRSTKGCLYASLIQETHHPDECISLTLWDSNRSAQEYEKSGKFQALMDEAAPNLAETSEWKIHLSEDMKVEYEPIVEPPTVTAYDLPSDQAAVPFVQGSAGGLFVRIVSPQIRHGMEEEFKRIYHNEIMPSIKNVQGCRYVELSENAGEEGKMISITVWDSSRDAEAYEQSGLFRELTKKVEHTFSEVYQWKMQLEKETHKRTITSGEMTVEGYRVVTGKSFL